jgi:hypothetical protein
VRRAANFLFNRTFPKTRKTRGAQGIEAEILLAQPKDWSEKPGFWRFAPKMRQNSEL